MALTTRQAVIITVGACAALALALLPPRPSPDDDPTLTMRRRSYDRWAPVRDARFAVSRAEQMLTALVLRDSVTSRARPGGPPVAIFQGPWRDRPDLRVIVERALDGRHAAAPVGVVLQAQVTSYRTTARALEFPLIASYFVSPDSTAPCLTLVSVWLPSEPGLWAEALDVQLQQHPVDELMGPCALAAAFGTAGPGAARWLSAGAAVYARDPVPAGRTLGGPGDWAFDWENQDWLWGWWSPRTEGGTRPWLIESLVMGRATYYSPGTFGPEDYALEHCRRERLDSCRYLLHDARGLGFRTPSPSVPELVRVRLGDPGRRATPAPYGLVAALRHDVGDERFGRFWRSALPLDSAFATAFGISTGHWMFGWVRATYGPPRYQASVGMGDAVVALVIAGGLTILAAGLAARRGIEL